MKPHPSDEDILSAAAFYGARDVDHPLQQPRTYDSLLQACGVYPVHGGRDCVKQIERQIRAGEASHTAMVVVEVMLS